MGVRGVETLPVGSAVRGQELFEAQCVQCHRVGLAGGVLGQNLDDLLSRSTLDAIILAIREPDALVPRGYKTVVVNRSGETVRGVLRNEDAFSLQMISDDQQLRAFRKDQVTISRPEQSLMPAFSAAQLSRQDINDILNYIRAASEDMP